MSSSTALDLDLASPTPPLPPAPPPIPSPFSTHWIPQTLVEKIEVSKAALNAVGQSAPNEAESRSLRLFAADPYFPSAFAKQYPILSKSTSNFSWVQEFPMDLICIIASCLCDPMLHIRRLVVTCKKLAGLLSLRSESLKSLSLKFGSLGYMGLIRWRYQLGIASPELIQRGMVDVRAFSHLLLGMLLGEGHFKLFEIYRNNEFENGYPFSEYFGVGLASKLTDKISPEPFAELSRLLKENIEKAKFNYDRYTALAFFVETLAGKSDIKTLGWLSEKFPDLIAMLEDYTRDGMVSASLENPRMLDSSGSLAELIKFFNVWDFIEYRTYRLGHDLINSGDLSAMKVLSASKYFEDAILRSSDHLIEAAKCGQPEMFKFLKNLGCIWTGPHVLPIVIKGGSLEILRIVTSDPRTQVDLGKLMSIALESDKEVLWDYCLKDLGAKLSSDLFGSVALRRDHKPWTWLKLVKCPFTLGRVLSMVTNDLASFQFFLQMENINLTDKQMPTLFDPKKFSVVEWALKVHRSDYKVTAEDLRKCLTVFNDDLMVKFMTLFSSNGYHLTPADFLWVLQNYDHKFHSDGNHSLAGQLVELGLFSDLGETLAKEAAKISSSCVEKLYVMKMLRLFKCKGVK